MSYDFSNAEKNAAVQELVLKKDETKDGKSIQLKFVKFQNVNSLTVCSHLFCD